MITSASNPKLRLMHRLLESRRQRDREGLFVVEGEDLVQAADDASVDPVEVFRAGEDVEPELLAKISTMGHPPRVMALFRRDSLPRGVDPVSLSLWRVGDPGNLGTILRAADAFGASVALSPGCADPTGPKALRASAGAVFRVPLAGFEEPSGKRVALLSHGATPLAELDTGVPVTYVLGAEREGLPDDVVAACDETATIPLAEGAESLNVAVAGAIALYEHRRGGRLEAWPRSSAFGHHRGARAAVRTAMSDGRRPPAKGSRGARTRIRRSARCCSSRRSTSTRSVSIRARSGRT